MYHIAVIKGDGTGPEVINEAIKVLKACEKNHNISFRFYDLPYNAKRYIQEGITLTNTELKNLEKFDAILLGAIGCPSVTPGILEREILLKIRFGLDQYINLRPVKKYKNVQTPLKDNKLIDYVVIRENTGGMYTDMGSSLKKGTPDEEANQIMHYTYKQVERCVRYAYEYTKKRHQNSIWLGLSDEEKSQGFIGKLTYCGKSNVLNYVSDLWLRVINEIGVEYPEIKQDYVHVDACCIHMIERPEIFDTIITTNMFGDIITDLAAVTQGGLGVASGGNINPGSVSMFEPIGGTAPDFTGKNQINPIAAIGAAELMLEHFNEHKIAKIIDAAKNHVINMMQSQQAGKMGYSTSEVGDIISTYIEEFK